MTFKKLFQLRFKSQPKAKSKIVSQKKKKIVFENLLSNVAKLVIYLFIKITKRPFFLQIKPVSIKNCVLTLTKNHCSKFLKTFFRASNFKPKLFA